MQVVTRRIIVPTLATPFKITAIGDTHSLSRDSNDTLVKDALKKISKNENHYWIHTGDLHDWEFPNHKYFSYRSLSKEQLLGLTDYIGTQKKALLDIYEPHKSRCLGILDGNHDERIHEKLYYDVIGELSNSMQSDCNADPIEKMCNPRLGYSALIRLLISGEEPKSESCEFVIYAHHGAGGGGTSGGGLNKMERQMANIVSDVDIYIMGHIHKSFSSMGVRNYLVKNQNRIKSRPVGFLCTGTSKKTYTQNVTSYGERYMHNPTHLGFGTITIAARVGKSPNTRTVFNLTLTSDGMPL